MATSTWPLWIPIFIENASQMTEIIRLMLSFYTRALPFSLGQLRRNQLLYVGEAPEKPVWNISSSHLLSSLAVEELDFKQRSHRPRGASSIFRLTCPDRQSILLPHWAALRKKSSPNRLFLPYRLDDRESNTGLRGINLAERANLQMNHWRLCTYYLYLPPHHRFDNAPLSD